MCFFINISSEKRKNEENVNNNDLQECISQDEQLTGNDKVYFMNHAGNDDLEDDNEGPEKAGRMGDSEGLNSIETTLAYAEQQKEVTTIDRLLFRYWCVIASEKRKGAQNQIPSTNCFEQ